MKTFQQFREERSEIEGARIDARKRAREQQKGIEKKASDQRKLNDLNQMKTQMQQRVQGNTDQIKTNSARLDDIENPQDDGTPKVDSVVGGIKDVGDALAQKAQEKKQKQVVDKQLQMKKKMMTKQHQLEKQNMQQMKKLPPSM